MINRKIATARKINIVDKKKERMINRQIARKINIVVRKKDRKTNRKELGR